MGESTECCSERENMLLTLLFLPRDQTERRIRLMKGNQLASHSWLVSVQLAHTHKVHVAID